MIDARIWALRWIYREEARVSEYQQERDADEIADAERFFRGIQDDARTEIHAEAAAMREALLLILEIIGNGGVMPGNGTDQCIDIAQKALASDAGRALVEELAAAKEALRVKTAEHNQTVRGFAEAERGYFDKNAALAEELAATHEDLTHAEKKLDETLTERDRLVSELGAAKAKLARQHDHHFKAMADRESENAAVCAEFHAAHESERQRADAAERRVAELETLLRGANESLVHTRAWMHRVDREAVARMLEIDAALAAPASEIHAQTITSVTGAGINRACPECNCISSHASHCSAAKDERRAMERVIEVARAKEPK